jgi:protein-tyrosine phosphatase
LTAPPLASVGNFRDFGGWPTPDGRAVATGQLFRSAHVGAVTAADIRALNALGVRFMVDLRQPDKRSQSRLLAGGTG